MEYSKEERFILAADIGGSHITVAVVDVFSKKVLKDTCIRAMVNANDSADCILHAWADAMRAVSTRFPERISKVALAMPGPFDYNGGVSLIRGLFKYESLYGVNVKTKLARLLQLTPNDFKFRNDAESFLHGEVVAGAGQHAFKVIGFTLGTGMGSAVSAGGSTHDANWGNDAFGERIADDYFSTRWFVETYSLLAGMPCKNVKQLAELAASDRNAAIVFSLFAQRFAGFVAKKIKLEEPELVVIGGNIAKASPLFLPELRTRLSPCIDPTRIVTDLLGEDAALIGAAFAFDDKLVPFNTSI